MTDNIFGNGRRSCARSVVVSIIIVKQEYCSSGSDRKAVMKVHVQITLIA